jgi:membrane-associated phospholipid phosphatase
VLAVLGLLVFAAGVAIVTANGHAPADHPLHDLARDLYGAPAKHVEHAISILGSLPVAGTLALVSGALLAARGRTVEAAVLVAGFAVLVPAVHEAKVLVGRSRPADALTGSAGSAYPSGHAAYSTVYVALTVIVASTLRDRAGRAATVAAGIAVALLIGVSRVYLRVHWPSDVLGGWALGVAIFATLATAALAVDGVRNNSATDVDRGQR